MRVQRAFRRSYSSASVSFGAFGLPLVSPSHRWPFGYLAAAETMARYVAGCLSQPHSMAMTASEIEFECEGCTELIFVARLAVRASLGAGTMLPTRWSVVDTSHDVSHGTQLLDSLGIGATMNANAAAIDAVFIGKQEQELLKLRAALLHAAQAEEDDEGDIRGESRGGPREHEDDAQKLALLEVHGNRVVRNLNRLNLVNRALEKIAEGTYGLSDVSGKPIPRQRLEAVPEAICTLDEEQRFELRADRGLVTKP